LRLKEILFAGAATTALLAGLGFASVAEARPVPEADTYADLLEPVPEAADRLAADDAQRGAQPVEMAQVYIGVPHHHHHHHHHHSNWYRAHGYYWNGGGWIVRPRYHHHHHRHHHHHHNY